MLYETGKREKYNDVLLRLEQVHMNHKHLVYRSMAASVFKLNNFLNTRQFIPQYQAALISRGVIIPQSTPGFKFFFIISNPRSI